MLRHSILELVLCSFHLLNPAPRAFFGYLKTSVFGVSWIKPPAESFSESLNFPIGGGVTGWWCLNFLNSFPQLLPGVLGHTWSRLDRAPPLPPHGNGSPPPPCGPWALDPVGLGAWPCIVFRALGEPRATARATARATYHTIGGGGTWDLDHIWP